MGRHALYGIHIYIWELLGITVTAELICVFVFAYAKSLFSLDVNQIIFRYPYIYMDFTRDDSHTYFLKVIYRGFLNSFLVLYAS